MAGARAGRRLRISAIAGTLPTLAGLITGCDSGLTGPYSDFDFEMVFVTSRDGNDDIYGIDRQGNQINLTTNPAHDRAPVWSPDGLRIAFTRQTGLAREVMVLDLDRGTEVNVSADADADDFDPSWSRDGKHLVFTSDRDGNDEIYTVDVAGDGLENLTRHPGPDRHPVWSPVGETIAFTSGRDLRAAIYVMDADGSNVERLTSGVDSDDVRPRWHPAGALLAFESNRDGASEIVTINAESGVSAELTDDPGHDVQPRWSPNGERVLFLSNRDDSLWDVWTVLGDGTGAVKVAGAGLDRDAGAVWSPDGTEIAFESRRAGNWDVYVVAADGSGLRAITTDGANDGAVAWKPAG